MKKLIGISLLLIVGMVLIGCSSDAQVSVTAIESQDRIILNKNDTFSIAQLPQTVRVTLSNQETLFLEVDWSMSFPNLDTSVLAVNTLYGDLVLPSNVSNPNNLRVSIVIEVVELSVLDYLAEYEKYSIFLELINETDLDEILALEGPFTIFVPTNDSFEILFTTMGLTKEEFLLRDDVADIVLYHVLTGSYNLNALVAIMPGSLNTLANQEITFSLSGPRVTLNNFANVTSSNKLVSNGFIHEVNQVLFPPSTIDDIFSDLITQELIDQITAILLQSVSLPDLISGNVSVTVFLPNQEALIALADEAGLSLQELVNESYFVDILTYHIVLGKYFESDLIAVSQGTLTMLNGESINVAYEEGSLTINTYKIISTELLMDMVVLHMIEGVLIPEALESVFN